MLEHVLHDPLIRRLFMEAACWFFFLYGMAGIAVGLGLVASHERMRRVFALLNGWVSVRRSTRWLAIPRDAGLGGPRLRFWLGAVFVLLPAYSLYVLVVQVDADKLAAVLRLPFPLPFVALLLDGARWLLIAGSALAIVVGGLMLFFPQALQALESRGNRWVSTRNLGRGGEAVHGGFDTWAGRHPRALGLVIALGAFLVTLQFGLLLFRRG